MGRRRPEDMELEELARLQVQEQPERRLGSMSMEQLADVEVMPQSQVLRGRVGAGPREPVPVQPEPPMDLRRAKAATAQGQVMRGRVGADPRAEARRLAELLSPGQIPDEAIDKDLVEYSAKGMAPEQQVEALRSEAKEAAVTAFAARQAEAQKKYQDSVNRARAEQENVSWLETILRGVADASAAYAGQGPGVYSGRAAKARADKAESDIALAKDARDTELKSIEAERGEANSADQASMLAQQLRSAGIAIPEGMERKNPAAFVSVYGPLVGKSADGPSEWQKYQIGRNAALDERHAAERAEDIAHRNAQANKPTQGQSDAALYASLMEEAEKYLESADYKANSSYSRIEGALPKEMQSPNKQQHDSAVRSFAQGYLRKASGGAVTPQEVVDVDQMFFPQPGEDERVVAMKKRMRASVLASIRAASGPAYQAPTATGGKPKTVTQGGHTYTLNEQTGEYE